MCDTVCAQRGRHLVKATKVTAGLAESNGSLPPGLWRDSLHVSGELPVHQVRSDLGPNAR